MDTPEFPERTLGWRGRERKLTRSSWGGWLPWVILALLRPAWFFCESFIGGRNFLRTPLGWQLPHSHIKAAAGRRPKSDRPGVCNGASCPTTGSKSDAPLSTHAHRGQEISNRGHASIHLRGWQPSQWPGRAGRTVDGCHCWQMERPLGFAGAETQVRAGRAPERGWAVTKTWRWAGGPVRWGGVRRPHSQPGGEETLSLPAPPENKDGSETGKCHVGVHGKALEEDRALFLSHTHTLTYTHTHTRVHTHMLTHARAHTHWHTHSHMQSHTHMLSHTHIHGHTHIHTRSHTHIHSHTHAYTHIHSPW